MRTWADYKNHVKAVSEEERRNMEKIESVDRIETLKTTPKLDTLVKLMQALNLKLQVSAVG